MVKQMSFRFRGSPRPSRATSGSQAQIPCLSPRHRQPSAGGRLSSAASLAFLGLLLCAGAPPRAEDFAFLHFTDVHSPVPGSRETIAAAREAGLTRLAPYNVTAPAPAFALVTGDLTEFGAGAGAWERFRSYFEGFPIPIYHVPGNHDQTWWPVRPALRALHGGFPYAFDHAGCHFIALDSAGRQDPRPGFGREELDWLRQHLRGLRTDTPLFLFFHHPLQGSEWASPYDYERLLEMLRPYHVALMLVGHGHTPTALKFGDYDAVEGGSTFGPNAGYGIVSVQGGTLRVAYRRAGQAEATVPLLEKPLAPPAPIPEARFLAPAGDAPVAGDRLRVQIAFAGGEGTTGELALDEGKPLPLAPSPAGGIWEAQGDLSGLPVGVHVLRARFRVGTRVAVASREFALSLPDGPRARWRVTPGGSIRAALAVEGDRVYAGSQDGALYALDAGTGRTLWRFATGGEILGRPAATPDAVYAASTDGFLYAVDRAGKERWRYAAGAPLSAPPVCSGEVVAVGAVDGSFHCVDRATGALRWRSTAATYTIESAACAGADAFYFGAWDTFVYALSAADGSPLWKSVGEGSRLQKAARYYSPADCAPVLAAGRLFVADRNYNLSILDAATGERIAALNQCAAVGASADGQSVYLRRTGKEGGRLAKVDRDGKEIWNLPLPLGSLPSAPVEAGGLVAVAGNTGLVSAVSAADGRLLWQYQATPGLYLPGGTVPANGTLYAAGLDGAVTAIEK